MQIKNFVCLVLWWWGLGETHRTKPFFLTYSTFLFFLFFCWFVSQSAELVTPFFYYIFCNRTIFKNRETVARGGSVDVDDE